MHIVKITDGLGNQMFQYAFAMYLKTIKRKQVFLDTRFINNEDLKIRGEQHYFSNKNDNRTFQLDKFNISLPLADNKQWKDWNYLTDGKEHHIKRLFFRYMDEDDNEIDVDTLYPTYFKGYFFSLDYVEIIKPILQREFTIRNRVRLVSDISHALKHQNTVSIHVRRGDFLRQNRDISQKSYYPKAVKTICDKVENPVFFVFSDDIQWVKENLNIPGEKHYISDMGFADDEEMMIMKYCRHNIIANSTFSYWGAYLNANPKKIVICPKRWRSSVIPSDWLEL